MKQIEVNGHEVTMLTDEEVKRLGIDQQSIIYSSHEINLYFPGNRGDLYQAAGMTITAFDWALPENWVDEQSRRNPQFNIYNYVWSYHKNKIFGEPLYLGDAQRRVFELAMKALVEGVDKTDAEWEL